MSPLLAALGAVLAVGTTLGVLAVRARVLFRRQFSSFRCRVCTVRPRRFGPDRRWERRRTRATWTGDVLLLRSGALRLWITAVPGGLPQDAMAYRLGPDDVRGLGLHPVALRLDAPDGRRIEVAAHGQDVGRLVGPFLTAAMSVQPRAPRERGTW
jgi:hypothetical protein